MAGSLATPPATLDAGKTVSGLTGTPQRLLAASATALVVEVVNGTTHDLWVFDPTLVSPAASKVVDGLTLGGDQPTLGSSTATGN